MSDPTPQLEDETFDLAYVVERTGAPSEDWLMRRIRTRALPACKAGRHWRMTRSDMAEVVAYMKRLAEQAVADADEKPAPPSAPRPTGLTDRARRSLARTA
ncbi:hypothetical protein [Nocardia salmonicida]|uniref:hypothetical protein n=1 Tax=Nocardia salmonicida TaxID=53431 RepID=UPI0037B2C304